MSFQATPSIVRVTELKSCATANLELQVECRSRRSVYPQQSKPLEAASREGGGDRSVILCLQNISMETQAQSRLAVLRRELCRGPKGPRSPRQSHQAYSPSVSTPIFGGKPGGRMPAAPLFTSLALDPRVNAKQEGSP